MIEPGGGEWDGLIGRFPGYPGIRSVVVVDVERVADSCGYAVPLFEFRGERSQLIAYAENKAQYQRSCRRVPFGPPSRNFPENGARQLSLSRATPLVLRTLRRKLSRKDANSGKF